MKRHKKQIDPIISSQEKEIINSFVVRIETANKKDLKSIRKDISKTRYKIWKIKNDELKDILLEIIEKADRELVAWKKELLFSLLNIFYFYLVDLCFEEALCSVLKGIEHKNGNVRERIRNIGENLRPISFRESEKTWNKKKKLFEDFLFKLGEFIKERRPTHLSKNAPNDWPEYIEDLKPSPYKTAVLLWDNLIYRGIEDCWISRERLKDVAAPTHNYENDEWQDDNTVDPDSIALNFWLNGKRGDKIRAGKEIKAFFKNIKGSLVFHLNQLGVDPSTQNDLFASFDQSLFLIDGFVPGNVFEFLRNKNFDSYTANFIIRGFWLYLNHFPIVVNCEDDTVTNNLVKAVTSMEMFGRSVPKDMSDFCILIRDAHKALEVFRKDLVEISNKRKIDMFKFIEEKESFAKSNLNFSEELEEEFGRDLIKCDELISIAHYALDLWVQKEPWSCHKKTPNQIVAIVLRVIQRFNEGVGRFSTFLSTSELSEFAGWKNPGNVITAAYAAYNAVVGEVYDQGLLTMTTVDRLEESEEKDYVFPKPPLNPDEILIRRSEIEEDIIDMLKEINSQSSLDYIKDIIYNENDTSDLIKVVSVFDNGGDFSEMSNILELANDAWNFFPHKTLGGKAPVEMSSP